MFGIGWPEIVIISVILSIVIVPVWLMGKILAKAGFSAWFSLISFVPIVNVIALWIFAFIPWPNGDQQR
jgi:hypothetical protein